MKLFRFENYKVTVSEEALMLKPFKVLWDRDKSKNKDKVMMELAYIYFFCDPRSEFQYLTDVEDRDKAIKEGQGYPADWEPDDKVKEAMAYYDTFKPTAALLLEDTKFAIDKLRKFLKEMDLNQVDDKGKPVYTLNTFTSTLKQIPVLIKELDSAEKALIKEIEQDEKVRGSAEKALYEDL